ncbi:hypothetical protein GCM10022206_25430 [Streptomyces chiangmaiensis]
MERQASAVDGTQRHTVCRSGAKGKFEQVVAGTVQFQRHHDTACRKWSGRSPFFVFHGTDQDHRPFGVCHDGHTDVAHEVAFQEFQPPRTEYGHLGLRRRLQQRVPGVVGNEVADNGEARVVCLKFSLRVVHKSLCPVVLVDL